MYNGFATHEAAYCYLNIEVDSLLIYIANSKAITERGFKGRITDPFINERKWNHIKYAVIARTTRGDPHQ